MMSMRRLRLLGRLVRRRRLVVLLVTSGLALGFLQLLNTSAVLSNDGRDSTSLLDGFSWDNGRHLSFLQTNKIVIAQSTRNDSLKDDEGRISSREDALSKKLHNTTRNSTRKDQKNFSLPTTMTAIWGNLSQQSVGDTAGHAQEAKGPRPAEQHAETPGDSPSSQEEGERTMFNVMPAVPGLGLTSAMQEALHSARVLGTPRPKRFLTVGIPTVKRERATYLYETLDSLLTAIPAKEAANILLLVYVADKDVAYNKEVISKLAVDYAKQLDSGLMQVITNKESMYPNLSPTRRTFNDSQDRVFWRCKQNIDTAFLFSFAANLSTYYIHIEDDVITARSFMNDIRRFIGFQKKPWVMLEFGRLGFIGKLFHSRDLPKLAACLIVFYQEQPVDLLVPYFIQIMTQTKRTYASSSLFQHIGLHSSLKNKKQPLKDKRFKKTVNKRVTKKYQVVNPEAMVTSNMQGYEDTRAMDVYEGKGYVFWAADINAGQFLKASFIESQTVSAVVVITSALFAPADKIYNATLRYGTSDKECEESNATNLQVAKSFEDGSVVWKPPQPLVLSCVVVSVESTQKYWALFSEFDVFTGNYTLPPPTVASAISTANITVKMTTKTKG